MGAKGGAGGEEAYEVHYRDEFEPWFISSRRETQWFDIRFRGYGERGYSDRFRPGSGISL